MASSHDSTGAPVPPDRRPAPHRRPSRAVYRRRRLVALVVLLAALALMVWGVTALVDLLGGARNEVAAATAPAEAPSEAGPPGPCTAGDLDVDLEAASGAAPGTGVPFTVTVTNAGPSACLVDVGLDSLSITVVSGGDRVWNSADCPAARTQRVLLLDVGDSSAVTIPWSGARSAAGCLPGQGVATAGTYRASTFLDGAPTGAGEAVFTLR